MRNQHDLLVEAGTAELTLVDDAGLVLELQVQVQLVEAIDVAAADGTVVPLSELTV